MKIIVLEGSPNKGGSTHMLADCFRQGAQEAGHMVELVDAAHANVNPCIGCVRCGYDGPCVQKDDVDTIRAKILDADMLVLATVDGMVRAADIRLTDEEQAYLEACYTPHALVGVMAQNR